MDSVWDGLQREVVCVLTIFVTGIGENWWRWKRINGVNFLMANKDGNMVRMVVETAERKRVECP